MSEQRIDKWLWAARCFKTRGLAAEAVKGGRVEVNDARVKPARDIRPGDRLLITIGRTRFDVEIRGLVERRGPAKVVSRAGLDAIDEVKQRQGYTFDWVSSGGSDFNYDFGVSFREGQEGAQYNFEPINGGPPDLPGISSFALQDGVVHHTYSSFARAGDILLGAYQWMDRAPLGRNENGEIMRWLQLRSEYDHAPAVA